MKLEYNCIDLGRERVDLTFVPAAGGGPAPSADIDQRLHVVKAGPEKTGAQARTSSLRRCVLRLIARSLQATRSNPDAASAVLDCVASARNDGERLGAFRASRLETQ